MDGEMCITPPASLPPFAAATPGSCCTFDYELGLGFAGKSGSATMGSAGLIEEDVDLFELRKHLILRELQQMVNRYNDCFCRLQATLADIEFLRGDNLQVAEENLRLALLIGELESSSSASSDGISMRSVDLPTKEKQTMAPPPMQAASGSDGEEVGKGSAHGGGGGGGVPKSISIRSSGFLASSAAGGEGGQRRRLRIPASPVAEVFKGEDGEVEVEVYSQGEAKTELCSNWGESGRCRYGRRCRFAHGAEELRPVIRHPRYKTQPCRMVGPLGGDCPYGHRCHFRHSIPSAATSTSTTSHDG